MDINEVKGKSYKNALKLLDPVIASEIKKDAEELQNVLNTGELSTDFYLNLGKQVASTDYAVCHFNNKNHPKFYHNKEALLHALRKAWNNSSTFEQKERFLSELSAYKQRQSFLEIER